LFFDKHEMWRPAFLQAKGNTTSLSGAQIGSFQCLSSALNTLTAI
jgi:hypothetical protein